MARSVGYFPDWEYANLINRVDFSALTNVNYFSIVPTSSGAMPSTSCSGYSFTNMDAVVTAAHKKGVSVSIVVGGAGLDSTIIPIAQSATATNNFVTNIKSFCAAHSLDGVDFDWEPAYGTATVAQITAFGNLLNAVKAGAPNLTLSAAVNATQVPTDSGNRYVVPASAVPSLDLINVMAYDLQIPDHANYSLSVNYLAGWGNYAVSSGSSRSKVIFGVPFYGHQNSWSTSMTYQQIVDTYPTVASDPTLDNAGGWYFNGRTTIQNKALYVNNNGFGGVMMWELEQDHFTNSQFDSTSLLPVIKNTLGLTAFTNLDASNNLAVTGDGNANVITINIGSSNVSVTMGATTRVYPSSIVTSITVNSLGGDDTLNFNGSATNKPITFAGGTGNDTLNVNSGTFTFNSDASPNTSNLTVNIAPGASVQFNAAQHLAALNVSGSAVVAPNASPGTGLGISTRALTFAGAGSLDLNNNDLLLDYSGASPLGAVQSWIVAHTLTSTTASNNPDHNTTLGAMEASDYASVHGGTFDGESPDATAVLVKYTYYGDANFDGSVNFDDYVRTDVGFNTGLSGWSNGDYNYSGSVDFDDYVLIDVAFNTQSATLRRGAGGGALKALAASVVPVRYISR